MAKAIIITVLVAVLAVWFYRSNPLPPYLDNVKLALRLYMIPTKAARSLAVVGEMTGIPSLSLLNITRVLYNLKDKVSNDFSHLNVSIHDEWFDGVQTRLYIPSKVKPNSAAIFNIHGGGWLFLNVPVYNEFCAKLADSLNVVVASVEYRLAPEHKYPTALDDCETSFRYFAKHASKWNVDASRIGVLGDSCGGNLASTLFFRLKRNKVAGSDPKIKFQILFYPLLQSHNFSTVSYRLNRHDYIVPHSGLSIPIAFYALGNSLPNELRQAGYRHMYEVVGAIEANNHSRSIGTMQKVRKILSDDLYEAVTSERDRQLLDALDDKEKELAVRANIVEELSGKEKVLNEIMEKFLLDEEFSPLMAKSVTGFPPTYFGIVGFDNLRYDSLVFAERLKRANVTVHVQRYMDKYHPYAWIEPEEMIEDLRKFLSENPLL